MDVDMELLRRLQGLKPGACTLLNAICTAPPHLGGTHGEHVSRGVPREVRQLLHVLRLQLRGLALPHLVDEDVLRGDRFGPAHQHWRPGSSSPHRRVTLVTADCNKAKINAARGKKTTKSFRVGGTGCVRV